MPNYQAFRARMGLIVPSTNVVAETDFWKMAPSGVSFHTGRLYVENPDLSSDDSFLAFLEQIRRAMNVTVRDVLTCEPDYMVMGMSSETFWGGVEGNAAFTKGLEEMSGMKVMTGAAACKQALDVLGVAKIAVITPYQPVGDEQVVRYFRDIGVTIVGMHSFRCENATAPARVTEQQYRDAIADLDGPDVEAIVQVGTNLSIVDISDEVQEATGKPVVAINAAILWAALRDYGIDDRYDGFGVLLREH